MCPLHSDSLTVNDVTLPTPYSLPHVWLCCVPHCLVVIMMLTYSHECCMKKTILVLKTLMKIAC